MKKLLILGYFFSICRAYECVYPVGINPINSSEVLYVMYQIDTSLELLVWNAETKQVSRVLSKRFLPSQVSILPDNDGFSFIDQGVIWVKSHAKRSPTHLEIPFPLRHIDYIYWKDYSACYFSALNGDQYALFELDRSGNLDCLLAMQGHDCLYPQKVDNSLFCIVRDQGSNKYNLIKSYYPHISHIPRSFNEYDNSDTQQISCASLLSSDNDCVMLYSFDVPVAFLNMVSDTKAFITTVPEQVYSANLMEYSYATLELTNKSWSLQPLFSFSLPHTSTSKTLELVLPFLPRYNQANKKIVYTSFTKNVFTVYEYDCDTGVSKQLSDNGTDSFAPCFFHDKIIWGGEIKYNENTTQEPRMWVAEGRVCLDLPCYDCLR
jgi:hypothetical protein